MKLVAISRELCADVEPLRFSAPVTHVYNPLVYARAPHELYLERFGEGPKEALLLGMNPGPWGMAQTGVPFGDPGMVREWLGLVAPVGKPEPEHPKRPVLGLDSPRGEVSGRRLWGWARDTWGAPERFFERFLVVNHCPLSFMEEGGRNRTPDKLARAERDALLPVCDLALRRTVEHLCPAWVIGVGAFAEKASKRALDGLDVRIGRVLHPSPASPLANKGWAEQATRELRELGITVP